MLKIPAYLVHWEAPEWCASAARSLLASEGVEVDLTVIDNGQSAGPPLESIVPAGVRIIPTGANLGYAGGANLALRDWLTRTSAEFCLIGSHDLHLAPGALRHLVSMAQERPDAGVVAPELPEHQEFGEQVGGDAGASVVEATWVPGTCMVVRRTCVEGVGGFLAQLGSYAEDVEFCWRCREKGWKVLIARRAKAYSLGSVSGLSQRWLSRNWILLARHREGARGAAREMARVLAWVARSSVGSLAVTRPPAARRRSRRLAADHAAALADAIRALRQPSPSAPDLAGPDAAIVIVGRGGDLGRAVAGVQRQTVPTWQLFLTRRPDDAGVVGDDRVHRVDGGTADALARAGRLPTVLLTDDRHLLRPYALAALGAELRPGHVAAIGGRVPLKRRFSVRPSRRVTSVTIWRELLFGWSPAPGQALVRSNALGLSGGAVRLVPTPVVECLHAGRCEPLADHPVLENEQLETRPDRATMFTPRPLLEQARAAAAAGRPAEVIAHYARAVWCWPGALRSPLARRAIVAGVIHAFVIGVSRRR